MNDNVLAVQAPTQRKSLVSTLAAQYDMEPAPFLEAVQQTVMPGQASQAQVAAFLMVCHEYKMNPFIREIYAFPSKGGGIQPVVSIDGWVKLINEHPAFNGMDIAMKMDENTGKPVSCTCTIFRKDRDHAVPITEYFEECYRNTEPWNKMPRRMMRHKAIKEAARYTFGFAGIMDEDEARDAINITNESTVLERSTASKTEAMKERIGAKKEPKAAEPKPVAPAPEPKPETKAPEPQEITPEPPAQVVYVSENQRKEFISLVTAKAGKLGVSEAEAKSKMREMLFSIGFTKFAEVPASRYPELVDAVDAWGK